MQRPGEIEVLEASLKQTRAMLQNSHSHSSAPRNSSRRVAASKAALDQAQAINDRDEAAVAKAEKRIGAAKLPGRSDMIDAATANAEAAKHALAEAETNIPNAACRAPRKGRSRKSISGPAKWLKRARRCWRCCRPAILKCTSSCKSRFAPRSASTRPSMSVATAARKASRRKSASSRETPSSRRRSIFSEEQRQKLVFLVEARPSKDTGKLTAEQPVTVTLGAQPQMVRQ